MFTSFRDDYYLIVYNLFCHLLPDAVCRLFSVNKDFAAKFHQFPSVEIQLVVEERLKEGHVE